MVGPKHALHQFPADSWDPHGSSAVGHKWQLIGTFSNWQIAQRASIVPADLDDFGVVFDFYWNASDYQVYLIGSSGHSLVNQP